MTQFWPRIEPITFPRRADTLSVMPRTRVSLNLNYSNLNNQLYLYVKIRNNPQLRIPPFTQIWYRTSVLGVTFLHPYNMNPFIFCSFITKLQIIVHPKKNFNMQLLSKLISFCWMIEEGIENMLSFIPSKERTNNFIRDVAISR